MENFKKEQQDNDTESRNLGYLCNMCGKCCRGIATDYTYEELLEMKAKGEKEAAVFVDFFKRYSSPKEALEKEPDTVAQILREKGISVEQAVEQDLAFYYCSYVNEGACTRYEERPVCCRLAPSNGWCVMPPGCGFKGWQYLERERVKEGIRALKEKLYEVETLEGPDGWVEELGVTAKEMRANLEKNMEPFVRYGSKGW